MGKSSSGFRMYKRQKPPDSSIDISEKSGVRFLHFGSDWVQGAMRINKPWSLELAYTREMMAGLLFYEAFDRPRSVLQIGLGAGSISRFIYRHLPDCRSTVVEINPQIEFIARQYFKLPDDPLKLDIKIEDGVDYVLRGGRSFDYLFVDAFDADAQAGALETIPFYQACRARLNDKGILAVNFLGKNKAFSTKVAHLNEAFEGRVVVLPSCESGNVIAFATQGLEIYVSSEKLLQRAELLKEQTQLDLRPTINRLQESGLLTNDFLRL